MTNLIMVDFSEDDYEIDSTDIISEDEWSPILGPNFAALTGHFEKTFTKVSSDPKTALQNWQLEVTKVTSRCQSPGDNFSSRAQLVLGRVQAGKTSNFTGVIGLLSDNNYDLFIVVAGISKNLRDQTFSRLEKDLASVPQPGFEIICGDPQLNPQQEALKISTRLQSLRNPSNSFANQFNRRLVYVVLKEDDHLNWLRKVIEAINDDFVTKNVLAETNILIIDDEVDQASPDPHTRRANQEGAIHLALSNIRDTLPTHTYLGYTATPYANLVMSEGDALRCQIVSVLDPGPDYVGAEDLFIPADNTYASEIFDWDFDRTSIPKSLRLAFSVFMIQASVLNSPPEIKKKYIDLPLANSEKLIPTSMLVHAHQETIHATKVFSELSTLRSNWVHAIQAPPSQNGLRDISYIQLWEKDLLPAIDHLGLDRSILTENFRSIVEAIILHAEIREINGPGRARGFDFPSSDAFEQKPAWVLIGGQLLDRGQTLPTLVNTYMPRSPGGSGDASIRGNIDTLQQRGRFYGQRRQYLQLLRGWFDGDALVTYKEIARIEPTHIAAVRRLDDAGLGIEKLPMVLELGGGNLSLVRSNVVPSDVRSIKNSTWLFRQTNFLKNDHSEQNNKFLRQTLLGINQDDWTELGEHRGLSNLQITLPLSEIRSLLSGWMFAPVEKNTAKISLELLDAYESSGHTEGNLVLMARDRSDPYSGLTYDQFRTARQISIANHPEALKITGLTSSNDARFVENDKISFQVHFFDIRIAANSSLYGPKSVQELLPRQVGLAIAFPNSKRLIFRDA